MRIIYILIGLLMILSSLLLYGYNFTPYILSITGGIIIGTNISRWYEESCEDIT